MNKTYALAKVAPYERICCVAADHAGIPTIVPVTVVVIMSARLMLKSMRHKLTHNAKHVQGQCRNTGWR